SNVGWVDLEDISSVGEELIGRHAVHLNFGRRLHVNARVDLHLDRCRWLAPLRQGRDFVTPLYLMHGVIVGRAVCLGSTYDPDIRGGCVDAREVGGDRAGPSGWRDKEVPSLRSCGSPPR